MRILTINAGSTSVKVAQVRDGATAAAATTLDHALAGPPPDAVAHRIVHGGARTTAARVDDALVAELEGLTELAPLHQPPALAALRQTRAHWPGTTNVACFDTAFHCTIPEPARTYALPARFRRTVRVYGFHGLAHAWAVGRALELRPDARRVVVAHLGGGQSLCAAVDGRSVMTTMGFTPLDGLVMATRCGTIDPGAVLYLAAHTDEDLGAILEQESGLLGLTGTADMREVHRRADAGDPAARLGLAVWLHRIVSLLGGCITSLGGLDALVFSGGIGEHDAATRRAVVEALAWLGAAIDDTNEDPVSGGAADRDLTASGAAVATLVVTAREDLQLAREAEALLGGTARRA